MQKELKGERPLCRRQHSFGLVVFPIQKSFVISSFSLRKTGSVCIERRLLGELLGIFHWALESKKGGGCDS